MERSGFFFSDASPAPAPAAVEPASITMVCSASVLTAYEQEREANIQRNKKRMAELLGGCTNFMEGAPAKKKKRGPRMETGMVGVVRKSVRRVDPVNYQEVAGPPVEECYP